MPKKTRFAVVGLGYFAQAAGLPAFAKAKGATLQAIVSGDAEKLRVLGDKYDVPLRTHYDDYEALLSSGDVDAVYIALPNSMHAQATIAAARAGVHVLCEKPMALDESTCEQMIEATREAGVKLMIGYRLHFDPAHLALIDAIKQGAIGEPRFFHATFAMQVKEGNIRLQQELGGGPLYDIGIYCINAARYAFQDEPLSVVAMGATRDNDARFNEVDEQISAVLRFSHGRLATFVASFGATHRSQYEVSGSKGFLRLEPAFDHAKPYVLEREVDGRRTRKTYGKRDQVAAEITYFTRCIRDDIEPEPSGIEGLADVRIMHAIQVAAEQERAVTLTPINKRHRPDLKQEIDVAPHRMPQLVHAETPSR